MIEISYILVNRLDQGIKDICILERKSRSFSQAIFYLPEIQKDEIASIINHLGKIKRAYTFMLECIYDLDHNEEVPEVLDIDFTFEQVELEMKKANGIINEARNLNIEKLNDNFRNDFIQYSRECYSEAYR